MARAAFRDLCLDAVDGDLVGEFWAAILGGRLDRRSDAVASIRHRGLHTLWINTVPEPKVVKNRVHLDLVAPSPQPLIDLGATVAGDRGGFVVLEDPGGNELCVFPGETGPNVIARPFALCVDSATPVALATWWQSILGGHLGNGPDGRPRWLHGGDGFGDLTMKFVAVDDPRSVKNRCHWDVTTGDINGLVAAGATVLHPTEAWTVLADPHGNEFCAFER